jgi:UDP-GlcNAc:undecaprenyl-phosphate GlcNAc-1-phosphate transferase
VRAYVLIGFLAALVTFFSTWAVLKLSHRFKLYAAIRSRDVHTTPTPRLGGAAMFLGFSVALAAGELFGWFASVYENPLQVLAIWISAALITLIGVLDDLYDLDWSLKLAGQFIVAGILAWQECK